MYQTFDILKLILKFKKKGFYTSFFSYIPGQKLNSKVTSANKMTLHYDKNTGFIFYLKLRHKKGITIRQGDTVTQPTFFKHFGEYFILIYS